MEDQDHVTYYLRRIHAFHAGAGKHVSLGQAALTNPRKGIPHVLF